MVFVFCVLFWNTCLTRTSWRFLPVFLSKSYTSSSYMWISYLFYFCIWFVARSGFREEREKETDKQTERERGKRAEYVKCHHFSIWIHRWASWHLYVNKAQWLWSTCVKFNIKRYDYSNWTVFASISALFLQSTLSNSNLD